MIYFQNGFERDNLETKYFSYIKIASSSELLHFLFHCVL